jgi:hypothetical protein
VASGGEFLNIEKVEQHVYISSAPPFGATVSSGRYYSPRRAEGRPMSNKQKPGSGRLAPGMTVPQVGAQQRMSQRQQQRNLATWLERMQASAAKHRGIP